MLQFGMLIKQVIHYQQDGFWQATCFIYKRSHDQRGSRDEGLFSAVSTPR